MSEEKTPDDIVIETSNPKDQNPAEKSEKELNTEDWKTVVDEAYLDYALKKASELRAKRRKREEEEIISFVTGKVREGVPVDEAISVTLDKIKRDSAELEEIILAFLERVWMCVEDANEEIQNLYKKRDHMKDRLCEYIKKLRGMEELPESLKDRIVSLIKKAFLPYCFIDNLYMIRTLEKLFNTTIDPSSLLMFLSSTSEQNASEFVDRMKKLASKTCHNKKYVNAPIDESENDTLKGFIHFLEVSLCVMDSYMIESGHFAMCAVLEAETHGPTFFKNVVKDNEEACPALCNKVIGMKEKLESECDGIYEPPTKVLKEGPKDERVGEPLV